jgi:hypothetical protein
MKLAEVVQVLMEAGEKRLAREAEELVQQVEAGALTSQITISIALSGALAPKSRLQFQMACRQKRA